MFQSSSKLLQQFLSRPFCISGMKTSRHQIASNIIWLLAEKGLRIGITFLMGIWVARYLGPEKFGLLSYAIAFTSLFSPLVKLGLDGIVVRDIVTDFDNSDICIGSTLGLRFIGVTVMFIIVVILQYSIDPSDRNMLLLVVIMAVGYLFEPFATLDLWFQSQVLSKYSVIAQTTATIISASIKAAFIIAGVGLIGIVLATSIFFPLSAAALLIVYSRFGRNIADLQFDKAVAYRLFRNAWPLMLQGMFVMAYFRIDQIMLKQLASSAELGIYSITVRLTEAFFVFPMIFCQSVYPSLIKVRRIETSIFLKQLQFIYTTLIWIAIFLAVLVTIFANPIIYFLFGHAYQSAGSVLTIQIWMGCWIFFNIARQNWIIIENIQRISLWINIIACGINVLANSLLIPKYGAHGAAISSILSIVIANFIVATFSSRIRLSLKMYVQGLITPFAFIYNRVIGTSISLI